jgi:chemotaxis signal transduction protein
MARSSRDQIHALAIPTRVGSLLVPSATIAEVVNVTTMTPVPLAPAWVLGVVTWRTLAVPVVSLEGLFNKPVTQPGNLSKAVVFYPLAGRATWEYFAILSSAEPRPQPIDASAISVPASEIPNPSFIAGGIKVAGQPMWIPNFDGFQQAFYPEG